MAPQAIAALRAVHGRAVLNPSDANYASLVAKMADRPGICYLRTVHGKMPVRTPSGGTGTDRRQSHTRASDSD
jgi:transketolase